MDELEDFSLLSFHSYSGCSRDNSNFKGRRSFSTSTPIINKQDGSSSQRSSSVSVCSLNDSGYAESLCSTAGSDDISMDITSNIEAIKQCTENDAGYQSRILVPFGIKLTDQASVKRKSSDHNFHSLDYEIPEEEQVLEKFSPNKITIPKYSLDFREFNNDENFDQNTELSGYQSAEFEKFLKSLQPEVPDRLIGRKIGIDHVDIFCDLQDRSMRAITTKIMDYLFPQDLCSMCQVSKKWRDICDGSERTHIRKLSFLNSRNNRLPGKENNYKKKLPRARRCLTGGGDSLATIQCIPETQILLQPTSKQLCIVGTQRDSFVKAAELLKNDEVLQKCPSCQHPSVVQPVQERGQCVNPNCKFDYCIKCIAEFHGSRPCVPVGTGRTKTASIGGKKSKKNLRRL